MPGRPRLTPLVLSLTLSSALLAQAPAPKRAPATTQAPALTHVDEVRRYIKRTWTTLTRSPRDLARAAPDPKMHKPADATWAVYVAADESRSAIQQRVTAALQPAEARRIDLRVLPSSPTEIKEHGLLYLPHAYVVPGGRFN
ncbi:MAG TPA: hypothetical protein VN654_26655, partial [Vicinamibacterales bacterium]|nr:hypothetical protein [Vicinamibacterales bacterium]